MGSAVQRTGVLIVGAGPAGLVLACELARRGVAYQLVERDGRHFAGSRGKGLQPRTQEVFEDLGVLERVRAHGGPYPPMRAYQGDEVVWEGRIDEPREPTSDIPYPDAWMLPQWRTGEILRERLAELGQGGPELGTELVGLEQDADGVTALLRIGGGGEGGDGSAGGAEQRVRADYVVGTDGGRSTVRRLVGVGFAGETREQERMVIADIRAEGVDRDHWHIWQTEAADGSALPLALCPLAGTDTFQLVLPVPPGAVPPEMTVPLLRRVLDAAAGPGRVRVTELVWTSLFRANIRMAERFREGRVFLAGDAAHVHSPAGGQGLNTSVQDAYNLGWKLAAVLRGAPAGLLDSYEEERLPVAAEVLGISTRLHDKGVAGDEDAHRRDDPALHQLTLGYRESSLSREYREGVELGAVLAGDRAPDAVTRDGVRLFEVFRGTHATLLAFGDEARRVAAGLAREAEATPGALALVAAVGGDAARRTYGIGVEAEALLLVRPDGYLGLALDVSDAGNVSDVRGVGAEGAEAAVGRVRNYLAGIQPKS